MLAVYLLLAIISLQLLLFFSSALAIQSDTLASPECGIGVIDLYPLLQDRKDWEYTTIEDGKEVHYYFHPCGISKHCEQHSNTTNAMLCSIRSQNISTQIASGDLTSYVYGYTDGNPRLGLTAFTSTGSACDDGTARQTWYHYSCPPFSHLDKTFVVNTTTAPRLCQTTVRAYTDLLCPHHLKFSSSSATPDLPVAIRSLTRRGMENIVSQPLSFKDKNNVLNILKNN